MILSAKFQIKYSALGPIYFHSYKSICTCKIDIPVNESTFNSQIYFAYLASI